MTMPPPPSSSRVSRPVRWALGVSLALNLVFIGFAGGAAFRFRDGHPGGAINPRGYATAYVRALPRTEQRKLRQILHRETRVLGGPAQRRARYETVLAALRTEPFEAAAVNIALDQQADMAGTIQRAAQRAWLAQISAMSVADRMAYADRLEAVLRHSSLHHRKPQSD